MIAKTNNIDHLLAINLRKTLGAVIVHRECREIDSLSALSKIKDLTPNELLSIIIKQAGQKKYIHEAFARLFNHAHREKLIRQCPHYDCSTKQ